MMLTSTYVITVWEALNWWMYGSAEIAMLLLLWKTYSHTHAHWYYGQCALGYTYKERAWAPKL